MKILLRSSKRKLGIKLSSSSGSFRKLFTVWGIKRLGYPAFRKVVSIVLTSLSKSEEMRFALWRAPVIQFLFHLVGISDFQCVGSFPVFS